MKIIPENDNVLCRARESDPGPVFENGVCASRDFLKTYEVVSIGPKCSFLKPGDVVTCCSTGTAIKDDDVDFALFSEKNVAAKILGS